MSNTPPTQRALGSVDAMDAAGKAKPLRLLHRLVVFSIALWYVAISVEASLAAVAVLRGFETKDLGVKVFESKLIAGYAGDAAINDSPLLQKVLGEATDLRNDSIYLETVATHSFTGCSSFNELDVDVYSNSFMRLMFSSLQEHATGNLSYIAELELVAPVVDCTFDLLVLAEEKVNRLRMYFLTRQASNSSNTLLLSMLMSTQDFQVPQQYQSGAALLATIAAIDDMRATEVVHRFAIAYNYPYQEEPHFTSADMISEELDNFLLLRSQPDEGSIDPAKTVRAAIRFGTYIDDPVAQSNIEVTHWNLPSDPASELSTWKWHAVAVVHDSWAWTHVIHAIFSLDVLFDLSVLFVVIYQRLQKGHFWIGDAFATISNALLYRGVLVLVSNHVNGYWTLTEFCVAIGSELSGVQTIYYRPELVHADLLTFFLNITSILSYLFRERIDPVLAFAAFELGFAYRVELVDALPSLRKVVVDFADANYALGLVDAGPYLAKLSPMKVWSIHEVTVDRKPVVIATVVGIFSTLTLLVFYILVRKAHRYFKLKTDTSGRRASRYVAGVDGLTSFESATGAALSKRYGVICGYENYVIRDSKRFASIDAVYGNGCLTVNNKFLVATEDILSLLVMKVTNVRFTNLYVYTLLADGGVNQTAQLVYPHTIPWSDFVHLGVAKLA